MNSEQFMDGLTWVRSCPFHPKWNSDCTNQSNQRSPFYKSPPYTLVKKTASSIRKDIKDTFLILTSYPKIIIGTVSRRLLTHFKSWDHTSPSIHTPFHRVTVLWYRRFDFSRMTVTWTFLKTTRKYRHRELQKLWCLTKGPSVTKVPPPSLTKVLL